MSRSKGLFDTFMGALKPARGDTFDEALPTRQSNVRFPVLFEPSCVVQPVLGLASNKQFDLPRRPRHYVTISLLIENGAVYAWEPSRSPQPRIVWGNKHDRQ